MNVQITTSFQKIEKEDDEEKLKEKALLKQCKGGPVYYKDYNGGAYVIGILNRDYKIYSFTKENMIFLVNMVNKGKLLRKKIHKGIDEEHIVKLDLSRNDFGPLDVKYLTDFDLKNLRILDLSSNSIKPQGAFYLSQGKYPALESLNLNFNEIGDEGLSHIANGFFNKLTSLFLFHNNISHVGISNLCKADFIRNLMILSLSENPNITDDGVRIIKEAKNWTRLNTLNLNATGLTDAAVNYLTNSSMPKLRKLSLVGNKFTSGIQPSISALKLNKVKVEYLSPEEKKKRDKEKQKKKVHSEQKPLIPQTTTQ
jgi:Ran GTPase-activating protein (RanGAP) involved in mRNA processing and transport